MESIKTKGFRIFILAISLFICAVSVAKYKPVVKQYSIIGDDKKEICEQFDEYNMFKMLTLLNHQAQLYSKSTCL
jgi:hypothetical protein